MLRHNIRLRRGPPSPFQIGTGLFKYAPPPADDLINARTLTIMLRVLVFKQSTL